VKVVQAGAGPGKKAATDNLTAALDAAGKRCGPAVDAMAAERSKKIRALLTAEQLKTFHEMLGGRGRSPLANGGLVTPAATRPAGGQVGVQPGPVGG
jgi:hypothetical protein